MKRSGFTLVEVLCAMLLVAIVIPVVMGGIQLSLQAALTAKHRNEAAGLGQAKLAELVSTDAWEGGTLSGDFNPSWPDYRWQATVAAWPDDNSGKNIQQVDLKVIWKDHNQDQSITLSALAYDRSSTISEQ